MLTGISLEVELPREFSDPTSACLYTDLKKKQKIKNKKQTKNKQKNKNDGICTR